MLGINLFDNNQSILEELIRAMQYISTFL